MERRFFIDKRMSEFENEDNGWSVVTEFSKKAIRKPVHPASDDSS